MRDGRITQAQWDAACRLVIHEGYSYSRAAEQAGISVSSVEKRAADERWQDQKRGATSYSATVRELKVLTAQKALEALQNSDHGLAIQLSDRVRNLESAFPELRVQRSKDDPQLRREVLLEVLEGLSEYLSERDRAALAAFEPHFTAFAEWMEARDAA